MCRVSVNNSLNQPEAQRPADHGGPVDDAELRVDMVKMSAMVDVLSPSSFAICGVAFPAAASDSTATAARSSAGGQARLRDGKELARSSPPIATIVGGNRWIGSGSWSGADCPTAAVCHRCAGARPSSRDWRRARPRSAARRGRSDRPVRLSPVAPTLAMWNPRRDSQTGVHHLEPSVRLDLRTNHRVYLVGQGSSAPAACGRRRRNRRRRDRGRTR